VSARPGRPTYAGLSDVGRVRTHNEDAVLLSSPLFAVADGLGGHRAGEIASTVAIEALMEAAPAHADAKALGRAVRAANRAVIEAAREGQGHSGMGTTLTAAIVEGTCVAVAHVGDSRMYLLHNGLLERITEDHSLVADMIRSGQLTEEESREHPNRSVITRALGSDPNMYADTFEVDVSPGDRLLLCSDGLTSMLTDGQIADILNEIRDPESAVRALVDAANAAGGHDNISVVLVDIPEDASEVPVPRRRRFGGWVSALLWVLALAALVFGAGWGVRQYAWSRAYLTAEDGYVVLYRGIPGTIAGVELRWLEEQTTIPVRELEPVTAARLAQDIPVDGVGAGREVLAEYRVAISETATGTATDTTGTAGQ